MEEKKAFDRIIVPIFIIGLFLLGNSLIKGEPKEKDTRVRVSFLNVGQGDSTLIKTPNDKYILVDGGPDKSVMQELGKQMPPTVSKLEAVILSHPHTDHVTGLNYILDRYQVGKIYLTGISYDAPEYTEFQKKIIDYKIPVEKYYEGRNIYIDEVNFFAYWPKEESLNTYSKDINDTSLVFSLNYRNTSMLFLGDISAKKQDEIADTNILKKANVIKVSHHGSKTGTSAKVIEITSPEYAVISVGADNKFGHPSQVALAMLTGQKVLRTDRDGTISFYSDGNIVTLK